MKYFVLILTMSVSTFANAGLFYYIPREQANPIPLCAMQVCRGESSGKQFAFACGSPADHVIPDFTPLYIEHFKGVKCKCPCQYRYIGDAQRNIPWPNATVGVPRGKSGGDFFGSGGFGGFGDDDEWDDEE